MNEKEISQFFECLGEIWRDVTAIEFLMRCAIAKKEGALSKFPQPPYNKGKIYKNYPDSFSHYNFETVTAKFNLLFPVIQIPQNFIDFRHAMAHGIIVQINNSGTEQLIKFRENKQLKELSVEFSLPLETKRLAQLRQSLHELKGYIMKEVDDNKK
jgi:hypothetical protein